MTLTQTPLNIAELRQPHIEASYSHRNVHDHLKDHTIPELQEITQVSTYPFWVMTLNVLGDLNLATVIRSAHLMGAEQVVVFGRRKFDSRGLVGAAHYTPVDKVYAVDQHLDIEAVKFEQYLTQNSLTPVFVEQGGDNCWEVDWPGMINPMLNRGRKPILVVGTERDGIPTNLMDVGKHMGGEIVSIPQRGVIRSHNLSMAFAIVAGQMVSQMGWF